MVIAVFAGVFGPVGLLPMFLAVNLYMVTQYVAHGSVDREMLITIILAGELPLLISYVIWHRQSHHESGKDRAYRDLANELSEVANKAEVVINAIADGVIAIDSQGVIQLINPAAQQLLGWDKQDAMTLSYKSVLQLSAKNDQPLTDASDPLQIVLATNKEQRTSDLSLATKSGKKLLVSLVASPVGQIGAGAIVVFRDITKERAEEREQAEFISTASHEMRTPVAAIEGYLGLALNPATSQIDAKARDFITKAHESAQHLGRLFQDLLDVSKAEDGRLSNNPKVVDVVAFAHDIVQGLLPKATEKGLRVLYKPLPDDTGDEQLSDRRLNPVYYAFLDNDHLREVIANLVENAIKYTPHGDVVIDVDGDNEHIVVSIQDSGIGIPAEDMPHLFQKFYRVDNSDTREIGGTGLGLYLCRRLAEAMNGRIWAESEYKKGSTFYLEIPRISHEEATSLIEKAAEAAPSVSTPIQSAAIAQTAPSAPPVAQPAPSPIPTYEQQPAPTFQQPAPQPLQPQVPISPPPAVTRPNIPLTSIEQTPSAYTQQFGDGRPQSVNIPPRDQQ
jgi:PAS domain S-box-containing protein